MINIKKIKLGDDTEFAVGQELNQLMLSGYRAFHDYQLDSFNIDHVVIGKRAYLQLKQKEASSLWKSPETLHFWA